MLADQETVRAEVWRFLEGAQRARRQRQAGAVQAQPRARLRRARRARLGLQPRQPIDPPAWLDGADDLPAAAEMFPVGNGLLHLPSGELYPPTPNYFGLTASDVVFDPDAPEPEALAGVPRRPVRRRRRRHHRPAGLVRLRALARHLAAEDSVRRRPATLGQGHHRAHAHRAGRPRQRRQPDARQPADARSGWRR